MHTPFVDTIKYLFLCFISLEIMHLLMRGSLNFTYIPIATLVLTVLYGIEIRRPEKGASQKVEKAKKIHTEKKAL